MLSTRALEDVLVQVGDVAKMAALERREGRSVREALVSRALVFGQLRYLNSVHGRDVNFDRLKPTRDGFADIDSWAFDRTAILQEAVKQMPGNTLPDLERDLVRLPPADPWSVLHGKDTLSVLAIGLRKAIGKEQITLDRLMQMLQLAFQDQLFRATRLYSDIKGWETANTPYLILPV